MTPAQLSEIEARLLAASTRSPWSWEPHGSGWAMYAGRSADAHGSNIISAPTTGVFDHNGENNRTFIANAPTDIDALVDEVKRLREALKQACMCVTCNGAGEIDVVTGYKDNGPNDPIEVYELDECPECAGQKIGSHVEEATARVLEECR